MTKSLPEYEKPPVVEVALGVQFETVEALHAAQLGSVWQAFRKRFPKSEEHPPLEPAFEKLGTRPEKERGVRFEVLAALPTPRLWFLNESGNELVQVQQNRFIRNWRKRTDGDEYPRYSHIRECFREDFEIFRSLVDGEEWGAIEPNQCEVTYVNVIPAGEGWQKHAELGKVCTLFTSQYSDEGAGDLEEAAVSGKYVLKDDALRPVGRLHFAINPAIRLSDQTPALRLTLTARGAPLGESIDGVLGFLDQGHDAIVKTFTSITTPEMHKIWKRTQ